MLALQIIWAGFNTLCAAWLACGLAFNPLIRRIGRWDETVIRGTMLAITAIHFSIVIAIGYFLSLSVAVVVSAALFLHWSLVSYFISQRFVASSLETPSMVIRQPMLLPTFVGLGKVSFIVAVIVGGMWYLAAIAVVAWFAYGFLCAEYSIRRLMRTRSCERDFAIFQINHNQGRSNFFTADKYPFP